MCNQSSFGWVSPFRNRRIKGYLLLPGAYRSLSRLSSALSAKASTICSFMLDQIDSYRFKIWMSAPSVVLIWFRFYILNCFVVYRNHLVLILGYWLSLISIPRMSWYFIWYSMCSFQGTILTKILFRLDCTEQSSGKKSFYPNPYRSLFLSHRCSACLHTSYEVQFLALYEVILYKSGSHLFCHTVTSIVSSAA